MRIQNQELKRHFTRHASRITLHPPLHPRRCAAHSVLDHSFDIVTVGYGLRNLANWETGLARDAAGGEPRRPVGGAGFRQAG